MKFPEVHVYGDIPARVVWRHEDKGEKNEVDLTPLWVSAVDRNIRIGETPSVLVSFIARLVEHQGADK